MQDTIIVDSHEPKEIIDLLELFFPVVEVKPLPVGDYQYHEVVFERKSKDFLVFGDVKEKSVNLLKAQIPHPHLIVDHDMSALLKIVKRSSRCKEQQMFGLIASLCSVNMTPLFCPSPSIMVDIMKRICDKTYDGRERTDFRILKKPKSKEDEKIELFMGVLPGIGEEIAKRMIAKFKTMHDLCHASVTELQEVKGISVSRAIRIHKKLNQ